MKILGRAPLYSMLVHVYGQAYLLADQLAATIDSVLSCTLMQA